MRVWGGADPRALNRKHLLGEHQEIHTLLGGGWQHHPESKRFRGEHAWWLTFRHELLRIAMFDRFGPQHAHELHASPIEVAAWLAVPSRAQTFFIHYVDLTEPIIPSSWQVAMDGMGMPPTSLGVDTPWDRDRMTFDDYLRLGNDWSNDYREGLRPVPDPHRIPVRTA